MARDWWKYYDEDEAKEEGEEKKALSAEKQCPQCFHWIERDASSCIWCGKIFGAPA